MLLIAILLCIVTSGTSAQVVFSDASNSLQFPRTEPTYGVAWGDLNGDGYPDIWVGNHFKSPSLFQNQGDGSFVDVAATVWPDITADAHGAAWADFDNDGDQDLLEANGSQQDDHLYVNEGGIFVERGQELGFLGIGSRSRSVTWLDWNRDGTLDLMLGHAIGPIPVPVLLTGSISGFSDSTSNVGLADTTFVATYVADINNDDVGEVFFSTGNPNSGPVYDASTPIWSDLTAPGSGLTFPINIGCGDTLLADFNNDGQTEIFASCGGGLSLPMPWTGKTPTRVVSPPMPDGLSLTAIASTPIYLIRSGDAFIDQAAQSGLTMPLPCASNVGGDYDNDMDIDIYLVCATPLANEPNVLLLNDGAGRFSVATGFNAQGTAEGRGESGAAADYDNDGLLDLFVTNGRAGFPGPYQLFHNETANDNNWIQVTLRGSTSNADAIGSTVLVTANGVTQSRYVSGGTHRRSQDFNRAHFGLGTNGAVDILEVRWTNGGTTTFSNVPANRILEINEDGSSDVDGDGVLNMFDNCLLFPNPNQRDTNGDGFGNRCDADLNNNGIVNSVDLGIFRSVFFTSDPDADFNGDGTVNSIDLNFLRFLYFAPPGPSGLQP